MSDPTISIAPSGNLLVELPSVLAEGRSHAIEIPFSLAGLSVLKRVLLARKAARSTKEKGIGSMGSPVASDIQKYLADRAREERVTVAAHTRKLEERYQIQNIELDL